jgi:hypothetical protein
LTATVVVAHHEDHDGLKAAAKAVAEAAKASDAAASFLVYKPVAGTLPEGLDEKLKFAWIREESGDSNAPALTEAHGDGALELINGAREGLNDYGSGQTERTRVGGSPSAAPKYVMAIGFTFDPSNLDAIKECADAFDEANQAAGTPVNYTVHKSADNEGGRLILIHADSVPDISVLRSVRDNLGAEKAQELRSKLEGAVKSAYAQPLELVPQVSNP